MLTGLNHLTLAVSDLPRSIGFYRDTLGLTLHARWHHGAYLSAGDLWLCLSLETTAPQPKTGWRRAGPCPTMACSSLINAVASRQSR